MKVLIAIITLYISFVLIGTAFSIFFLGKQEKLIKTIKTNAISGVIAFIVITVLLIIIHFSIG
jgi:polyferredoxin